jgi:hypothetical protein
MEAAMSPLAARPAAGRAALAAALLAAFAAAPLRAMPPEAQVQTQAPAPQVRHLGRLFSTPQQRAQLDAQRDGNAVEGQAGADAAAAPAPAPPAPLQLNGVVQRKGGRATVWLNDAQLAEPASQVLPDRSVLLHLPSGKRITLKAGQSYDETTGAITNAGQ